MAVTRSTRRYETPAAFKASKVQTAKYWGAAAAKDQFKKNVDSLLPDAIKQQFTTTPATLAKAKDLLVDGTTAQTVANLRQLATKPADLKDGLTEIGLKEDTDVNGHTFVADVKAKVVPVVNSWTLMKWRRRPPICPGTRSATKSSAPTIPWWPTRPPSTRYPRGSKEPCSVTRQSSTSTSGTPPSASTSLQRPRRRSRARLTSRPSRLGVWIWVPLVAARQSGLSRLPAYTGGPTYHGTASLPGEVKKAAAALDGAGHDANAKKKAQDLLDVAVKNAYPKGSIVSFAYPFSTAKRADKSFAASGTKPLAYVVQQPIKSGKDVSLLSDKPNEEEVLFPQGARLKWSRPLPTAERTSWTFPGVKVWVRVAEA